MLEVRLLRRGPRGQGFKGPSELQKLFKDLGIWSSLDVHLLKQLKGQGSPAQTSGIFVNGPRGSRTRGSMGSSEIGEILGIWGKYK